MGDDQETDDEAVEPKLKCLLGDIDIDNAQLAPLGGLNPHSKFFDQIGRDFLQLMIEYCDLSKTDKVLEIGCGTGRISKQLLDFGNPGNYHGFDNNARFIDYCKATYDDHADFSFYNIQHDEYNQNGTIKAEEFVFPYTKKSFDIVCTVAVFNHFKLSWAIRYINEIGKVLKHGGMFFGTFILRNARSTQSILKRNTHPFLFSLKTDAEWYEYDIRPLWNVALPESAIRRAFIDAKMIIQEPIRYGEWCGSPAAITGHDVIIAKSVGS